MKNFKNYRDYLNKVIKEDPSLRKGMAFESWLFSLCINITRLRKAKGLSQGEFAKRLGVSQSVVGRIESGQNMTCSTLWNICDVLDENLVILGASKETEKRDLDRYLKNAPAVKETTETSADSKAIHYQASKINSFTYA